MKRFLVAALAAMLSWGSATAQVENRALLLQASGKVECGVLPEMNGIHSYTVQLWFKPTTWKAGATLVERGDMRVALGTSAGKLAVTVNGEQNVVESASIANGQWQQLTLINARGRVTVLIDRQKAASFRVADTGADMDAELTLGGNGYKGLIDEVRIWNTALTDKFDYFWNNTLNEFNQQLDNLLVYYKMDHEEWTESLVDYKSLWVGGQTNHHGIVTGGQFVGVDRRSASQTHVNAKLPYLLNGAYTNLPRFCDASIPRESYLLSNDIICLFIEMGQDGHLSLACGAPTNHATVNGTATWLPGSGSHQGLLQLDGSEGCTMTSPGTTMNNAWNYSIEGWIKLSKDEWTEGATILRKGDFSVQLGTYQGTYTQYLVINVGDQQYSYRATLADNKWHYIGISPNDTKFNVVVDDKSVSAATSGNSVQLPQPNAEVVWGEGLKATLDDWCIWNTCFSADDLLAHKSARPLPKLGGRISQSALNGSNTYYRFNDEQNPGFDTYSADGMKSIMEAAFDGYRGYQFRIAVRASTGEFAWDQTICDQQKRQNFADDLARLCGTYDGVEFDLEWVYYDGWETFGDLIDQVRTALPKDKSLMVSMHNVSWKFVPTNRIPKIDGFTMQQYGPQNTHSTYASCTNAYNQFKSRYPKEKIYLSWATITSKGSNGGAVRGVNWGAMGEGYEPGDDMDAWNADGQNYYFMSPIQVYRRAKFAQDQACQGIFYWDMANDYRVGQPYCMARYATYGLNANVDRIVREATPAHTAATGALAADPDQSLPVQVELRGERIKSTSKLKDGAYVAWLCGDASFDGRAWIGSGERYDRSEEAEWTPATAIFRLDKADNGTFYLYNLSNQKYVGHATDKSTRGDFYDLVWCDDTSDSRTSHMAIKKVSATGSLYLPETASDMFNLEDKAHSTYSSLKVGDTEANFGYLGTNSWKVWLMYAFDKAEVDAALGIVPDGIEDLAIGQLQNGKSSDSKFYDLTGRPVQGGAASLPRGLYILNGRKVLVK